LENPSQCEGFETKEKERETFCGRFGKRTPFLRWRARLHKDVSPNSTRQKDRS